MQCCLISKSKNKNLPDILFGSNTLKMCDTHVGRLCRIWLVLEWTHFLCGEICSKEDWLLIQVQAIFHALASSHPLRILSIFSCCPGYNSETRRQTNWRLCLHRLSLAHRRNVSALSLYYRYYHGRCSDELKSVIPPKACFACSTRFADSQHSFAVKSEKCRTTTSANKFVPMTSRNWNSLLASIFPSSYNLQTFKTQVHNHPRLHPLTWSTFPSLQ